MIKVFNSGWQFQLEGTDNWQDVTLPHDWLIYDTLNLYKTSVGKYRKTFNPGQLLAGQKVFLHFDGVYMDSTLYINGKNAGEWKHGYTAFSHEITPFLQAGENEILLTVNYQSPNSRWYSGAGIYRDCYIVVKNAAHFVQDGVYITPVREGKNWRVHIEAEVAAKQLNYEVRHAIAGLVFDDHNSESGIAHGKKPGRYFASLIASNPQLWDINNPHCYTLISDLYVDGQLQDTVQTRFGFREIAVDANHGFMLNGRRVALNGVCQHHDLGGLGAAVHKDALRRQLEKLREMGVNAIRTAHNPPAAVFMELADEMGFLIQSEFTDMWKKSKTQYDYARFFEEWVARDVAAWVRRDRNCPSVIMWSVGNEIYDTHADAKEGGKTLQMLMNLVKTHDPNRHGLVTFCSNYMPWENTQKCADIIKLIGYNYAEYLYHDHHKAHPDWIIYGGETASTVQSRGVYHFPLAKSLLSDDDLQCSALGNSTTSWGAKTTEACITDHRDAAFTLGQFIWTGTDYIGEPTPYHTKNSYFGQIDTAGFAKDSFYIYQSAWTDFEKNPMVHLFPHWDWNAGQPVDVRIASNAPRVELFLNGKSLGAKNIDHKNGKRLTADYIVPYETGEIKAVAYHPDGTVAAETARRSFGDAAQLVLENFNYGELTFTEISAIDVNGNPVENANNRVHVQITNGELLALDNGDSTDYDPYKPAKATSHSRKLFNGKLLAITKGAMPVISATLDTHNIPVRKIEIIQLPSFYEDYNFESNPRIKSDLVSAGSDYIYDARIFPENATYKTLHWRVTDAGGIDSPLASMETLANSSIKLTPKGDGEIFVRCAVNNGKNHPDFISMLPVTLAGFGKPFLNPYTFLSGGLHNRSNVQLGNGNDRGVATLRDGESHVGFADLNFGTMGASEFTIDLFPLSGEPFSFDIYTGMPNDGGHKISTAFYDKGSKWNTYIPVTYTLPKRLTGIQTLCFVFDRKAHIRGFQFTALERAFAKNYFAAHDKIYGDTFTVRAETVEKIGNNVTITFEGMNFAQKDAREIEISWRAQRDNTIRMVFTPENGSDIINLLPLPAQDNYASTRITLDTALTGSGTINFIFLPGTEIDLGGFTLC
ncbi:MAG: DUF4982 domain-containing protein [Defluviitaleaceae bacterium]|nr:DUF4982 domain-containing protein [Defluviitaleaceae bacterium]MCL2274159.1 DUF4982 domain-containing protein [Defluviitaleaceae bacterium]